MKITFFDIETIPASAKRIAELMPDDIKNPVLPPELQEMPPVEYKLGNLKDPAAMMFDGAAFTDEEKKIKAMKKFQADHAKAEAAWNSKREEQKRRHESEWRARRDGKLEEFANKRLKFTDEAALKPESGELILLQRANGNRLGVYVNIGGKPVEQHDEIMRKCAEKFPLVTFTFFRKGQERLMLEQWWRMFADGNPPYAAGYCINIFDNPFLYLRSIMLGVKVPARVTDFSSKYSVWNKFIDLHDILTCGRRELNIRLSYALQMFDLPPKAGDGAQFWQVWEGDPIAAVEYGIVDVQRIQQLGDKVLPSVLPGYEPEDKIPERYKDCDMCDGVDSKNCSYCKGTGRVPA